MTNLRVFAIGALAAMALTACKADYNCSCKDSTGADLGTSMFTDAKPKDAETACTQLESTKKLVDPGATCTLTKQ